LALLHIDPWLYLLGLCFHGRKGLFEEREIRESLPSQGKPDPEIRHTARSPIEYATNCTFTIKSGNRIGTGFLISPNGYAATCRHVIEGGSNQTAVLNDQREFPVYLISSSRKHDLTLLQIMVPEKLPYLSLRHAETIVPGERLFAIGASAGLQATVTDGVFTGFRRIAQTDERLIQFSAPVNQGNSGGPLVDEKGNAVGIVSLKYLMREGLPVSGVGFAIPASALVEEFSAYIQ
jgi:S1-C subfamily serine protease